MWEMTAAQRAFLVGPDERERKVRKMRILPQAELERLVMEDAKKTEQKQTSDLNEALDEAMLLADAFRG